MVFGALHILRKVIPLCVWAHSLIKFFVLVSTAAQSSSSVCFDIALLLCQHVCVKRPGCTDVTGLWKSKPISLSENWGVALCIQTCFNKADALWHRQSLVHNEGQDHIVTRLDSHTWHWPTASVYVHVFCYLWCQAWAVGWQFCQCCSLLAQGMTWHWSWGHSCP